MGIAFNGREVGGLAFNGREIESGYINGRKVFPESNFDIEYVRNILDNLVWSYGDGTIYSDGNGGFIIANYISGSPNEILAYNKITMLWDSVTLPKLGSSFSFMEGYSGVFTIKVNNIQDSKDGFIYSKDGGYTWILYPWAIGQGAHAFAAVVSDGHGAYLTDTKMCNYHISDLTYSKPIHSYNGGNDAYCFDGVYFITWGGMEYSIDGGQTFSTIEAISSYNKYYQSINILNGKAFVTTCTSYNGGYCTGLSLYYVGKASNIYEGKPFSRIVDLGSTHGQAEVYTRLNAEGICYCESLDCFLLFIPGNVNFNQFSPDGIKWYASFQDTNFTTVRKSYYVPGQGFYIRTTNSRSYAFANFKG